MALMSNQTTSKKNYSYIALIVALAAFVAAILMSIVRVLIALEVFTVANVDKLNQAILIALGLAIVAVAIYAILDPEQVRRFLTGRQARYGSNALIMTIAFLFIVGLVNMLYANPKFGLNKSKDVTADQNNTLAPETMAALMALPEQVTATAFFGASDPTLATELLNKLRNNSNGKFNYRFVNPDLAPQAAMKAGVTGDGKILLEMGNQSAIVAYASEEEILKGLLRLLNPESSAIYFLTGHAEHDTEQSGDASMTRAVSTLESKNYSVKTLNLLVDNKIPEDARVIVVAGPNKPLTQDEVKLLKEFLDQGGSLIVMEDPIAMTNFGEQSDPLAGMLSKDWGINFDNNVVVDLNSANPTIATATYYDSSHPITVKMNKLISFYPFSRSLSVADPANGITLTQLVRTTERSWGETDFATLSDGGLGRSDSEALGPLTLAVAGENPATNGRVVVFGTSEFAVDQIFDRLGNGDMFVNSVDWAAEKGSLASITPKNITQRSYNPPSQLYGILIFLTSIFIIPGLIVLGGVSTWLSRRRQG
jgi:ABC-type uncharacterized transport system involved in gliding motility auxiliary subunit